MKELSKLGWKGLGRAVGQTKLDSWLRWASPVDVTSALEAKFVAAFGSREEAAAKALEDAQKAKVSKFIFESVVIEQADIHSTFVI